MTGVGAGTGPLSAERVLDLSTRVAGSYCTKMLGDLGAHVVKVEAAGSGDAARRRGPFPPSGAHPEASAEFLYFNTSKKSVELDLDDDAGRDALRRLVQTHDVVVSDGTLLDLDARGIGFETLREWNDAVILTTISGFGSDGPYSQYKSNHLTTCALGGWALTCGTPDREPLQSGGNLTQTISGAYAAVATLAAVEGRAAHGRGDHVDVSDWEAALTCAMGPTANFEFRGDIGTRHTDYMTGPSFNLRCKDGYVGVNVLTEAQWQTLCLFIGREDMVADARLDDYFRRLGHIDEIRAAIEAAISDRPAVDVFTEAQAWRLPFGLVLSPAEALELPVHSERRYFVRHDHPVAGDIATPRVPFVMTETNTVPTRAPLLGEHTEEVLEIAPARSGRQSDRAAAPSSPLAGLRILDLTMFMSGPLATLIAGDLGADVIKIEAIQRLDGWRSVGRGGRRPWENSGLFNWINRNKRGITLNLADSCGADLLRRLVATADVVIENYTPRVMGNFGLDYESLKVINPDLIMVSMPGFGGSGECRDYAAFAWTTEQMSTICHLTGYEGGGPLFTGTTCGDPLAGLMGALALLAAVNHRRRTGSGQHVDLSQVEASTTFVGEFLVEAQITGTDPTRHGNANRFMSPHGIYPCRDDGWVAIACEDDEAWSVLRDELLTQGAEVAAGHSLAERVAVADEIDDTIAAWTRQRRANDVMHDLQRRGVAAATLMDGPALLADPHLRERGYFLLQDRDEIGTKSHLKQPFRMRDAVLPEPRRTAYLGEHNREVLSGILGLSDDEIQALERDQVIGTWPVDVPRPVEDEVTAPF
ncbi:MAG: CaiB/BaiF CoA transferase family protein [Acidimicrobiia bacterium]